MLFNADEYKAELDKCDTFYESTAIKSHIGHIHGKKNIQYTDELITHSKFLIHRRQ